MIDASCIFVISNFNKNVLNFKNTINYIITLIGKNELIKNY